MIISIMLYNCEIWKLTERDKGELEAMEINKLISYSTFYKDFTKRENKK
jgi:hypothetical protein